MMYGLMSLLLMLCPMSALFLGLADAPTPTDPPPLSVDPMPFDEPHFIDTTDFDGVVIPENYLEATYGYGYNISWTPNDAEILAMDEQVADFLRESDDPIFEFTDNPPWERMEDYKRHYYGLTIDGEDVIHAEYYCAVFDEDTWWEQPLIVMDGGACFFRFDYNPKTEEFFNLDVNGMA